MTIRIILGVLVVVALVAGYFAFVPQTVTGPDDSDSDEEANATTTEDGAYVDHVEEQWPRYEDEQFPFTLLYPPDAETRIENERVKVTYLGPDNTMGSEITDGFTAYVGTRSGSDVAAEAEAWLEEDLEHAEVVEEIEPYSEGEWSGYTYTIETALGSDATRLVLETDADYVLTFSYNVADPAERGHMGLVEYILDSITLQ